MALDLSEVNKRAIDAQKDWDSVYNSFIMKIVLFSSWILTTSITWYIALYEKVNIQDLKNIFIFIVIFSLIVIVSWFFRLYISSVQKFIEAWIHISTWELSKLNYNIDNFWEETYLVKQSLLRKEKFEKILEDKNKKHKFKWIIWDILFYTTTISFCLTCVSILVLFFNIG